MVFDMPLDVARVRVVGWRCAEQPELTSAALTGSAAALAA